MSDYKPFATSINAKLLPLSAYIDDAREYRSKGMVPDEYARSLVWNRAIRQATMLSSALAELADNIGISIPDSANISNVSSSLDAALDALINGTTITIVHNTDLSDRNANDSHPISAITDLSVALAVYDSATPSNDAKLSWSATVLLEILEPYAANVSPDTVANSAAAKDLIDDIMPSKRSSWGNITGTVADQTDLANQFQTKLMVTEDSGVLESLMYANSRAACQSLSASYPEALVIFPEYS